MMQNRLLIAARGFSGVGSGRTTPGTRSQSPQSQSLFEPSGARRSPYDSGTSSFESMLQSAERRFQDAGSDRSGSRPGSGSGKGPVDGSAGGADRSGRPGRGSERISTADRDDMRASEERRRQWRGASASDRDQNSGALTGSPDAVREEVSGSSSGDLQMGNGFNEASDGGMRSGGAMRNESQSGTGEEPASLPSGPAQSATSKLGASQTATSQSEGGSARGDLSPNGLNPFGEQVGAEGTGLSEEDGVTTGIAMKGGDTEGQTAVQSAGESGADSAQAAARMAAGSASEGESARGAAAGPGEVATAGVQPEAEKGLADGDAHGEGSAEAGGNWTSNRNRTSQDGEKTAEDRLFRRSIEGQGAAVHERTQKPLNPETGRSLTGELSREGNRRAGYEAIVEEGRREGLAASGKGMAAEESLPGDGDTVNRLAVSRWRSFQDGVRRSRGGRSTVSGESVASLAGDRDAHEWTGSGTRPAASTMSSENIVTLPYGWSFGGGDGAADELMSSDLADEGFDWREFVSEIREVEEKQGHSSTVTMSRLAQLPIANLSIRQQLLPGLTQQVMEAASGRAAGSGWQRQSVVLDDGNRIQLATRRVDGVLQVKISSVNSELNRILIQHQQEIREHLEENCDLKVELQFEEERSGEHTFEGQAQSGFAGFTYGSAGSAMNGAQLSGRGEKTVENAVEKVIPVPVRNFGYNQMEWTV